VIDELARLIGEEMASVEAACALTPGVQRSSYFAWRARGEEARSLMQAGETVDERELRYVDFLERMEAAHGLAEMRAVDAVRKGMVGWTERTVERDGAGVTVSTRSVEKWSSSDARWWLSRRHPERYSEKAMVEHSGAVELGRKRIVIEDDTDPGESLAELPENLESNGVPPEDDGAPS
jgi:hypothetical protein